jgi:hypothetical protein
MCDFDIEIESGTVPDSRLSVKAFDRKPLD